MNNGNEVWIHPHGSPLLAIRATIDLISQNQRSIALRLHQFPVWAHFRDAGMLFHTAHAQIEMLLTREAVGPWVELMGGGHYEILEGNEFRLRVQNDANEIH